MKQVVAKLGVAALVWLGAADVSAIVPFQLIVLEGQNVKWGYTVLGTPAKVTVGLVDRVTKTPGARNCARMQPIAPVLKANGISAGRFRDEVKSALRSWEKIAGISFQFVDDSADADILIGAQLRPRGRAFANVMHDPGDRGKISSLTRSYICLNPTHQWKVGFDGRLDVYDLRYTVAHELGHAIGLNHPGPEGQLMSFRYGEKFRTPQPGDIAGAVLLYGPPAPAN